MLSPSLLLQAFKVYYILIIKLLRLATSCRFFVLRGRSVQPAKDGRGSKILEVLVCLVSKFQLWKEDDVNGDAMVRVKLSLESTYTSLPLPCRKIAVNCE